ncbi:MAG: choice-of-anchor D domain-containing protein [Candidatus Binatia bacterium]
MAGPDIDVQPASLDYGNVLVGSSSDVDLTVQNTGTEALNVSEVSLVGMDIGEFAILAGGEPFTLLPGETRIVTVRFAPTSPGAKSATLRFISNDPDENPKDVPLSGTGTTDTGSVDCNTLAGCQVPDRGSSAPAVQFNATRDDTVHIIADIFNGFGCTNFVARVEGDVPVATGLNAIFIQFQPDPLPPGTEISIDWNVGTCAPTGCINYTIGVSPGLCGAGEANLLSCNLPASLFVGAGAL